MELRLPAGGRRAQNSPLPETLKQITPMESFNIIYFKLPIICAIFLGSPWILFQVWSFIAPGLYRRERRWAAPFILVSAGLFIGGGIFAYFVIFRYGLTFLLSIGLGNNVEPMVSMTEYFDLFVNVVLGVGLVFELPVLIFFLTLLRIVSPGFLVRHSRYAILAVFVLAAIITPTPDVFNLMLFATPMCMLFYVGVLASYLLVLHREQRRFPWRKALPVALAVLLLVAEVLYLAITKYGYNPVPHWPFLFLDSVIARIEHRKPVNIGEWCCTPVRQLEIDRVPMDLYKAIQDLYAENEKLERVIASLEELQKGGGAPARGA